MRFKKYNNNPNGLKTCDCVVRALSNALNKSWLEVYNGLVEIGRLLKTMPNSDEVIYKYLEEYKMITPKVEKGKKRLTAEEFKEGVYILKQANHLTSIKDGFLMDIWDCRKRAVYRYWLIKGDEV